MAVTATRDTQKKFSHPPRYARGIVQAGTAVYEGAFVLIDTTSGYTVDATDAANRRFFGVSMDTVAATATTDTQIEVCMDGQHLFAATGITALMQLTPMLIADNETFDNTAVNNICCGSLIQWVTNTSGWVDISMAHALTADALNIAFADGGAYVHEVAYAAANVDAALEEGHADFEAHIMEDGAGGANDPDGTLANMEHNAGAVAGHGSGISFYVLDSGAGIAAETVVCSNGITGGIPDVIQSVGTTGAPPAEFYAPNAIGAGANGWVFKVYTDPTTGLNTGAAAAEDPVYRSATGTMTLTKPTGANQTQQIGKVLTVGANGDIQLDLTMGFTANHHHTDEAEGGELGGSVHLVVTETWVKNGAAQAINTVPLGEFPYDVTVHRAYVAVDTATGGVGTVAAELNTVQLALLTAAQTQNENEGLAIAVPANTDWDITITETAGGASDNLKIWMYYTRDA